jgi:molybdopterin synthase catalytic subunit
MTPSSSSRPAVGDRGEAATDLVVADRETSALSAEPLDMVSLLAGAHHPGAGAVVLFSGEVRDNNRGRAVAYLEYEAHGPLAEKVIAEVLLAAREKYALRAAAARHRTGRVSVGESAVVVVTAAAHRGEAYAANQYIIDRIKREAPIWKREYFTDGASEWGANP